MSPPTDLSITTEGVSVLTITHTHADGTTIGGTSRGDGTAAILKSRGWRWGRQLGRWYVPRSRDNFANNTVIEATADALRADGFGVSVTTDDTPRIAQEVEAARAQQAQRRKDAAARDALRAFDRAEHANRISDQHDMAVPVMGEPIKVGHHSEAGHRRAIERARSSLDRAVRAQKEAERAKHKAALAQNDTHAHPTAVANRIARLEVEVRRRERQHDQIPSERTRQRLAQARDHLEYWQQIRAEQLDAGLAREFGPDNVKPGDLVRISGGWRRVVRSNARSVSVASEYGWTNRAPWHAVQDHQPE